MSPARDVSELLLDHAAAGMHPAASLLMQTYAQLRPEASDACRVADVLGGFFLECVPPVAMQSQPVLPARMPEAAALTVQDGASQAGRAALLIEAALKDPAALAWRWRWFGVAELRLPVEGLRLLRVRGGCAAPRHSHTNVEYTLVLAGAFADDTGAYQVGDIATAGPHTAHRPRNVSRADCVCLVASLPLAA